MGMLPYWIPFVLLSFPALKEVNEKQVVRFVGGVLIILIGFRYEVGGDWGSYLRMLEEARGSSVSDVVLRTDPAYGLLNWIGANWFGGIYFVNFVCALLSVGSLVHFCNKQVNPRMAMFVALPFLVTVVFGGLTRQGVAVGFGMLAMLAVRERRIWVYLALCFVAVLFHKTAICLLVLGLIILIIDGAMVTFILFVVFIVFASFLTFPLFEKQLSLYIDLAGETGAVDWGVYSHGAFIRVFQSVVAAMTFFMIMYYNKVTREDIALWGGISVIVMMLFAATFWRSTLADRLALYFIPLQVYAFSTFPNLFTPASRLVVKVCVAVACGSTLVVWLTIGQHAVSWLPYKTVLLQWL